MPITAPLLFRSPGTAIAIPESPRSTPAPITPFPFQSEMVAKSMAMLSDVRRLLWIAAPACGKTFMSAMLAREYVKRGKRLAFIVEMNTLASQAADDYADFGLKTTSYWSGKKYDPSASIIVVSAQTLESRIKRLRKSPRELLGDLDLIIGDECHTTTQRSGWAALMEDYPESRVLGMTGTPWNKGDKSLHYHFDQYISAPQPPDLIRMGRLVPVRGLRLKSLFDENSLKLNKSGDDFDLEFMQEVAMGSESIRFTIEKYHEGGQNRSTIAYCTGIAHAIALAAAFNSEGIAAEVQIGSTSTKERAEQKKRMMARQTQILCTVGTCTKGYNLPIVSCILLPRAIGDGNKNLYHQITCRGNRTYTCPDTGETKQDCILIDLGGNIQKFGHLPTDWQEYHKALEPPKPPPPTADMDIDAPSKRCPECLQSFQPPSLRICPHCGYEFNKDVEDQLFLFDYKLEEYFSPTGCEQVQFLRMRKYELFRDGKDPQIATREFTQKFGFKPPNEWHQWSVFGKRPTKANRAEYYTYLGQFDAKKDRRWSNEQMILEFGGGAKLAKFLANWKSSWWDVLGVARSDPRARAKEAYLSLAKQWHPDICPDTEKAKEQMQILNRAWEQARRETR